MSPLGILYISGMKDCSIKGNSNQGWKDIQVAVVLPRSRIPGTQDCMAAQRGGHFGVMKLHRVRERFFWGKVRADVEQWCKSCDACATARKGAKDT
ncbi:hypothetical protein TNCV_3464011 [Trichonephila clavipes]|nr:hypothetical protein TNCV_3464011 [Trichonephila clavipes]